MSCNADMTGATALHLRQAAWWLLVRGDVPPVASRHALNHKALAWLRVAPRTAPQLAQLLGITPRHAAIVLWRLRKAGQATSDRSWPRRWSIV